MNKEQLDEALKIIHEPITVNSVEYKYFDIDNYNKLVNVIDYCHYLYDKVKPYVEAQDKEIERLNNIIEGIDDIIKNHYIVGHTVQNASIDSILKEIKELKESR